MNSYSSVVFVHVCQNLNLSDHVLLHDGLFLWRIRRDRVIPIHVVLLDSLLLLLQKQDDKLVLRCEHTVTSIAGKEDRRKLAYSPIIRLTNVLVRPVATGEMTSLKVGDAVIHWERIIGMFDCVLLNLDFC